MIPRFKSARFFSLVMARKISLQQKSQISGSVKKIFDKAWVKMPQSYLRVTCESVRNRLERLIEPGGRHFE